MVHIGLASQFQGFGGLVHPVYIGFVNCEQDIYATITKQTNAQLMLLNVDEQYSSINIDSSITYGRLRLR